MISFYVKPAPFLALALLLQLPCTDARRSQAFPASLVRSDTLKIGAKNVSSPVGLAPMMFSRADKGEREGERLRPLCCREHQCAVADMLAAKADQIGVPNAFVEQHPRCGSASG
jgi:hypothetical protein